MEFVYQETAGYASVAAAWAAALVALLSFGFNVLWNLSRKGADSKEAFIFRALVGPNATDPVLEFYSEWLNRFQAWAHEEPSLESVQSDLPGFGAACGSLSQRTRLLTSIDDDFCGDVSQELENLEDDVALMVYNVSKEQSVLSKDDCDLLIARMQSAIVAVLRRCAEIKVS